MNSETNPMPSAEPTDYLQSLWLRLDVYEPGKPREEWCSEKAKNELRQIDNPLFISTAREFLRRKFKEKFAMQDYLRLQGFFHGLLTGSLAAQAKALLVEIFEDPKLKINKRIALIEAATAAKTAGITEYVLPLFSNRNNGFRAAEYFTAVPDPAAVDVLGQYFLDNPMATKSGGIFTIQALYANRSPRLLKYIVPVLEKERQGKSEADIDPRTDALSVIGWIGDVSATPLVIKELQNYSDKYTICAGIHALSNLPDERAYDTAIKVLSDCIKKNFEIKKEQTPNLGTIFTFGWTYFHKIGRDKTPEVMALLSRLAAPEVWRRVGEQDQEFLEERYKDLVGLPDLEAPRQRLTAVYRDEARPMPERISAFNELLDTFREDTRESVIKKYITPESEKLSPAREGWHGEGTIQFADLQIIAPDGTKCVIEIRRSEKRNSVVRVTKQARF